MSMDLIETLCADYSRAQGELITLVASLDNEIKTMQRRKTPGILAAVKTARDVQLRLEAAIEDNRALFAKPRTRSFHRVKVGLQKGKGRCVFADERKLIEKIRRDYEGELGVLIKVKETVVKAALEKLPAADLKKLGVQIIETGDQVFIKLEDTDTQKQVAALLEALGIE